MEPARAEGLLAYLSQVPDPRGRQGRRHSFSAMLTEVVCGLLYLQMPDESLTLAGVSLDGKSVCATLHRYSKVVHPGERESTGTIAGN